MGALLRFLPGLGPAIAAFSNPWLILIALAALAGAFLAGMHEQTIRFEAAAKDAQDEAIEAAVKFQAEQRRQNEALSTLLTTERNAREHDKRDFDEALKAAGNPVLTQIDCPARDLAQAPGNAAPVAPGSSPDAGGSCRLSAVGVRLWNRGLALGVDDAHRGLWANAANAGAGPIEINAAIDNVAENAELLGECRDRELAWQVKACENGWWTGDPCQARLQEFKERKPDGS